MRTIDFKRARAFLADDALPLWSTLGAYDNGCFVEHLDLAGRPIDPGFTRVRVQARQIYVFSHAEVAGVHSSGDLCARSVEFLLKSAWLGPDKGWAKRITRHGVVIDPTFDLYDVSFALFALGWRYRVCHDPRLLEIAHATLDFLERRVSHPKGGFLNDDGASFPRQQNPHMHLVEALNVWIEATGEARFVAMADALLTLLEQRFVDPTTGALFEFFNEDWSRLSDARGQVVEPGHQFEWSWIVGQSGRLTGKPRHTLIRRLIDSGLRAGYDPKTGLTIDQVDGDGKAISSSRRLWPQTEAIKACTAEAEFLDGAVTNRVASILDALFERFLDPGPLPGTWIDHYDWSFAPLVDKVPASSLYHVTLAFIELLRCEPKLALYGPSDA